MNKDVFLDKLKKSRVVVVGLGKSGEAVSRFLYHKGYFVTAIDSFEGPDVEKTAARLSAEGIQTNIGAGAYLTIKQGDIVVISPGIKPGAPVYSHCKKIDVDIVSELDIGWIFCPAPIIAVTGSNGKSTVVTLIGEILRNAGMKVWARGNIGTPLSYNLGEMSESDIVVCEVSSFQLWTSHYFHPKVAIVLNIHHNHMDWHSCLDEYTEAKKRILRNMKKSDYVILNADDPKVKSFAAYTFARSLFFSVKSKQTGGYIEDDNIVVDINRDKSVICNYKDTSLLGIHNTSNIIAASIAGRIFNIKPLSIKQAICEFKGLDHRIQLVGSVGDVNFINDSKSTTVEATIAALKSCDKDVVLIAGGKDKGIDFSKARDILLEKVNTLVLIGEASNKLQKLFSDDLYTVKAQDLSEAVNIAYQSARDSEADVLLSPMCSSFDMFKNFENRGEAFKQAVQTLMQKHQINV